MLVRIAVASTPLTASLEEAVPAAVAAIEEAGRLGARIVCLPETGLPGHRVQARPVPDVSQEGLDSALAEVARLVPRERLLVETDAPFLSPPGAPRKRNEPEWVRVTAAWLAEQRGEAPDVVGDGLVAAYDFVLGRS